MPVSPKILTNTRIPNAVRTLNSSPAGENKKSACLRKTHADNKINFLEFGIKNRYQYDRTTFFSGITPGDNGYLNDGGIWSTSADSTSRFYLNSPFEWWDSYVIYCNQVGSLDGIEIYIASDLPSLNSITNTLIGSTVNYVMQHIPGHQGSSGTAGGEFIESHYLRTPSSNFNLTTSHDYKFLISFYAFDFSHPMTLFSKRTSGGQCDFEVTIQNDTTILYTIDNQVLTYNIATMSANTWYDIDIKTYVQAFGGGALKPKINLRQTAYGSPLVEYLTTSSLTNTTVTSSIDVTLGCSSWNSPSNFFNGYLDEFYFIEDFTNLSYLNFNNFAGDSKSFTDAYGKIFTVYPDPTDLTEHGCLESLNTLDFLCVNTHYPDITVSTAGGTEFTDNLQLILDFGFIPSYPRGGNKVCDLSGLKDHTMTLFGPSYSYISGSVSNSGGGAIELLGSSYGSIPWLAVLNDNEILISVWVKIYNTSLPDYQNIVCSYDFDHHSGYILAYTGGNFTLIVGNGTTETTVSTDVLISSDTWYNVVCVLNGGEFDIFLSDNSTLGLSKSSGSGDYNINTSNDFIIGGTVSYDVGSEFNGQISLVSVYNSAKVDIPSLWKSYTGTFPNRYALDQNVIVLRFNNISNANSLVGDATDLGHWNSFFDLPASGTEFKSVFVVDNDVRLCGGSNINLKDNIFDSVTSLIQFIDTGSVISTGSACFANCTSLTTFYSHLTSANNNCFSNCISLVDVGLPSLSTVGQYCFSDCTSLTTLKLPSLTTTGLECFKNCSSITTFNFPSLLSTGLACFDNCSSATIFDLPSLTNVGDSSFAGCSSVVTFILPNVVNLGTTTLSDNVFSGISSNTITLTVPHALMTCNLGSPDGDIQDLESINSVTVITV
jgi:hypothetical protein